MDARSDFDVLICGGGLAGLTLARQLKLELPAVSVAVVDRLVSPLPEAAFKVGESAMEQAAYYYGQVLQLHDYFKRNHLLKLGLRFFFGDSHGPLEARPETGIDLWPPQPSYQIDRGRLENDLRQIVREMGVTLLEGTLVDDIVLARPGGGGRHRVDCRAKDGQARFSLTGRWVVDALGRRRLLQTKLGLKRPNGHQASAAWWRYAGRLDVDDMAVTAGPEWRRRNLEARYFSTNHLMGKGYWVWLIPLSSGATSLGIVTDETIHPRHTYGKSYADALRWLQQNEPVLWEYIRDLEPLDFLTYKNYSYGSAQVFSPQRWSCVGEAGFFLDPLYGIGGEFIALSNTLTVDMIRRDRASELSDEAVQTVDRFLLECIYATYLDFYLGSYRTFGHARIFTAKLLWDTALGWAWFYQLFVQGPLLRPTSEMFELGERYRQLNERMQNLFIDWAAMAPRHSTYLRADLTRMPFMQVLGLELKCRRNYQQTMDVARKNLDRFEELAQVLFWQAVAECYPDHPLLKARPWVNVWRMSLNPDTWAEGGVLEPASAPRPLDYMRGNFTGVFARQTWQEVLRYELPYRIMHWGRGFVFYRLIPIFTRLFFVNKPGLFGRRLMIRDYPPRPASGAGPRLSRADTSADQ